MSIEQNKVTAGRWFFDIIAQGQLEVADEIFAANHVIHDPHAPPSGWPDGPEGLKMVASVFGGGFRDWQITIEDQIAEGDRVASRWVASATNTGPVMGMPATGKTVHVTAILKRTIMYASSATHCKPQLIACFTPVWILCSG